MMYKVVIWQIIMMINKNDNKNNQLYCSDIPDFQFLENNVASYQVFITTVLYQSQNKCLTDNERTLFEIVIIVVPSCTVKAKRFNNYVLT